MNTPVTFGTRLKNIPTKDFIFTEAKYLPATIIPEHSHARTSLSFVLEGAFEETFKFGSYNCDQLSLLIKNAGDFHSNKYGASGARCLIIEISPEKLKTIQSYTEILNKPACIREKKLSFFINRIYRELNFMDSASILAIEGLMFELLADITRSGLRSISGDPGRFSKLRDAIDFIHENYTSPISLSDVADYIKLNPAHLARMFRNHHRCSIGSYVRKLRLEWAKQQLAENNKSLTALALELGFYDYSHFSHAFKAHVGFTPFEFRTLIKNCKVITGKSKFSKKS